MKKLIAFLIAVAAGFLLVSCNRKSFSKEQISQLRDDLFCAEGEFFKIYAYPETRETPMQDDGFIGTKTEILSFKISYSARKTPTLPPTLKVTIGDKEYTAKFENLSSAYYTYAEASVSSLPEESFLGKITFTDKTYDLEFVSQKRKNLLSYMEAIDLAVNADNEEVASFFSSVEKYEIRVRILESDGFNYWYVGLIGENGGIALLYDAETGDLIATKKTNKNV